MGNCHHASPTHPHRTHKAEPSCPRLAVRESDLTGSQPASGWQKAPVQDGLPMAPSCHCLQHSLVHRLLAASEAALRNREDDRNRSAEHQGNLLQGGPTISGPGQSLPGLSSAVDVAAEGLVGLARCGRRRILLPGWWLARRERLVAYLLGSGHDSAGPSVAPDVRHHPRLARGAEGFARQSGAPAPAPGGTGRVAAAADRYSAQRNAISFSPWLSPGPAPARAAALHRLLASRDLPCRSSCSACSIKQARTRPTRPRAR